MKLWHLKLNRNFRGWDCLEECVVRAETEDAARVVVASSKETGDEGSQAWISQDRSTCTELSPTGPRCVLVGGGISLGVLKLNDTLERLYCSECRGRLVRRKDESQ